MKQPELRFVANHGIEETAVLKVTDYNVSFDDVLLENVNFEIKSTDKVALIGSNGTGKTTLLREIFKNKHPSIEVNKDLTMAYLSQVQDEILNESHTILEEFYAAGFKTVQEIRSYISNLRYRQHR
ncbi:ATP-binding cassette domain-containing protein [Cytobacillus gottheilii]|uniref:ATP-binding cassette domain-containing protein n=1 Tax=Cytobacillus gottheilii TaxID=859144 RepID=UPI003F5B3EBF